MIKVPKSSLTIVIEEKCLQDYQKMVLKGQTPPGIGHLVKKELYQGNADLEDV